LLKTQVRRRKDGACWRLPLCAQAVRDGHQPAHQSCMQYYTAYKPHCGDACPCQSRRGVCGIQLTGVIEEGAHASPLPRELVVGVLGADKASRTYARFDHFCDHVLCSAIVGTTFRSSKADHFPFKLQESSFPVYLCLYDHYHTFQLSASLVQFHILY
jgi:hypothetical protein